MKKAFLLFIFILLLGCSKDTSTDIKNSININRSSSSPTIYESLKNGEQIKDFLLNYLGKGKIQATIFEWGELIESEKYNSLLSKMKNSVRHNESYFIKKYFSNNSTNVDLKNNIEAIFNYVYFDDKLGLSNDEYSELTSLYFTGERELSEKGKAIVEIQSINNNNIVIKGIEGTKHIKNLEINSKDMTVIDEEKTVFTFVDNMSIDEKGNKILFSFVNKNKVFHLAQRKNGDIILNYTILNLSGVSNTNSERELLLLKWI